MRPNKKILRIGITGGTGSGKTTFSGFLRDLGYKVIDADEISRSVYGDKRVAVYLKDTYGEKIMTDGMSDRKKTAEIVFHSPEELKKYLAVIMPLITGRIREEMKKEEDAGSDMVFLDAPLLFETEGERLHDISVLIDIPYEEMIRRVMTRDNITQMEVEGRIRNQMSREEKLKKADIVIENSGSLTDLKRKAAELTERIKEINDREKTGSKPDGKG